MLAYSIVRIQSALNRMQSKMGTGSHGICRLKSTKETSSNTRLGHYQQECAFVYARKCALRNLPVCDFLHAAMSSGVPVTTTSPPA